MEKSIFAQMMAKKKKDRKKVFGTVLLARLLPLGQEMTIMAFTYTQYCSENDIYLKHL